MLYGIKQVNKFKSNKSKLRKQVNECIDYILTDVIMHNVFEYVTIPYFLKDNNNLPEDKRNTKRAYSKNRYHNLPEDKMLELKADQKEYQKNYREMKKA